MKTIKADETICGYCLKERIGSGGYGEVWAAEAPGGLTKAVKIIYGYHDETRAERELKALNRIKQVRHPFLLSLERIDISDGQLVVVTELADMSLKDRYDACIAEGGPGIPREELLRYVADAAEALDYISETQSLQHLDIKPENLLISGGHVKVADFGLVKEIEDATVSLMGGLTPIYAAPELFDGRPCQFSDQYSLAIVYQEMLTAIRPFSGSSAAQLAAQHMQGLPKLNSLPRSDQSVIGRALAKDPRQRYPNCRKMVEGLVRARVVRPKARKEDGGPARTAADTEVITPSSIRAKPSDLIRQIRTESLTVLGDLSLSDGPQGEVTSLPPIDWDPESPCICPTLFLGVGRTATRTLAKLRGRLQDRFGSLTAIPAFRFLCLDTDRRDLLEMTRGEEHASLELDETLEMPLRTPDDYRGNSKKHLAWLSRRWLFNIPRTLQTEGIRPLGRLAFADHVPALKKRLRLLLEDMISEEAEAATAAAAGMLPLDGQVRVFILASIAGGAGSGMVLDVAYAVRHLLEEFGLPDDMVVGILMHAARHVGSQRDLAIANTCACLSELYYFSGTDGYPGDESCGLPPVQDNRPTFSDTYFLHLGEELSAEEMEEATDAVAEYLYLSAATKCASLFDSCREQAVADESRLRTFGLTQIGCVSGDLPSAAVGLVCHEVLASWLGDSTAGAPEPERSSSTQGSDIDVNVTVAEQLDRLGLSVERLVDQVLTNVKHVCGGSIDNHVSRAVQEIETGSNEFAAGALTKNTIQRLDDALGVRREGYESSDTAVHFQNRCAKRLKTLATEIDDKLTEAVLTIVDRPAARVHGATITARRLDALLRQVADGASGFLDRMHEHRHQMENDLLDPTKSGPRPKGFLRRTRAAPAEPMEDQHAKLRQYAQSRLQEYVLELTISLAEMISGKLSALSTQLLEMRREVNKLTQYFPGPSPKDKGADDDLCADDEEMNSHHFTDMMSKALLSQIPRIAIKLDRQLQERYLEEAGGLHTILTVGSRERRELPAVLRAEARSTVLEAIRELDLAKIILDAAGGSEHAKAILQERLDRAKPAALHLGGAKRLIVTLPKSPSSEQLAAFLGDAFNEQPMVVERDEGDLVLCYEAEQVALGNLIVALMENRPERVDYVTRLHTRIDISWPSLPTIE